ncbi:MAG: YfhO family protein [Lachnospiraceae bacterium]|nr:YfhO family protein [Candidatus Colinaster scatohippi]
MMKSLTLSEKVTNKYWHACIAGVLVLLMYIALLVVCRIAPFGENTWIMYDLKRQYVDFYSYLKTIYAGQNNVFYSFSTALGSGTIGFFIYYLSNPLFVIFCFFDEPAFPIAVSLIIGITLVLGAVIMDMFLQWYICQKRGYKVGRYIWIVSVAWAFSGFLIAQSMNMMWTDVVISVPIVIYFLEKMLESNNIGPDTKMLGYSISIMLLLLFNYYITYQVLIFVGLWTLMILFVRKDNHPVKGILRVAVATIIPVLIDMAVLLPTLLELFNSPKDIFQLGLETTGKNLMPTDVLSKTLFLAYDVIQPRFGLPQLYCGIIILILFGLFFASHKIEIREKLAFAVMGIIFLVSFCLDIVNLFWHAGMEPSGHPYRQAPLCVFMMLVCACSFLAEISDISPDKEERKQISLTSIAVVGVIILVIMAIIAFGDYEYVNKKMILINLVLLVIGAGLIAIAVKLRMRTVSVLAILGVLVCELTVNAAFTYPFVAMKCEKVSEFGDKIIRTEEAVNKVKAADSSFYRMESQTPRQQNECMMYGFNGVTHYSSAGMTYVRYFLQRCGYNDDGLYTHYGNDNTVTMDSMLGVKYLMTEDESIMHPAYVLRRDLSSDRVMMYENSYALPVALGVRNFKYDDVDNIDNPQKIDRNPFKLQEELFGRVIGEEADIFVDADVTLNEYSEDGNAIREYEISPVCNGEMYMYIDGLSGLVQNMVIYKNGELLTGYCNSACYKVLKLGNYDTSEKLTIKIVVEGDNPEFGKPLFVTENIEELSKIYDIAVSGQNSSKATVSKISSSHLKIEVPSGDGVFTSIPYEEGWHIRINGKKIEPLCIYGALMYIPTGEAGMVDMYFIPKGFIAGLIVTLVTLAILAIYIVIDKKGLLKH